MDAFTPQVWEDFIGQRNCIGPLDVAIRAAIERANEGAEDWWRGFRGVAAVGTAGTGKSTLAPLVAQRLGLNWCRIQGGQLRTPEIAREWVRRFAEDPGEFLFVVDEGQLAPPGVLEEFFHVLTHGEFIDDDGASTPAGVLVFWFTANYASELPEPLLSRCLLLQFELYESHEIQRILTLSARRCGYTVSPEGSALLASAAWGTPRRANHLLQATIDGMVAARQGNHIESGHVAETFARLRLYPEGLGEIQVAALKQLSVARHRRLGVRTLAAMLGRSERDVLMRIEPPLLRLGYVVVAANGREVTPAGLRYLKSLSSAPSPLPSPPILLPPFSSRDFAKTGAV